MHGNLHRDRGSSGEFTDRRLEPALGQHRGMHPARELAQLGPGRVNPRPDFRQRLTAVGEHLRPMSESAFGTSAELEFKPAALFV